MGIVSYPILSKDEDDKSLLALLGSRRHVVNVIFLKYSKEDRLFSSHVGIRNISSDDCYDDTKHYQPAAIRTEMYSEPLQASKMNIFA